MFEWVERTTFTLWDSWQYLSARYDTSDATSAREPCRCRPCYSKKVTSRLGDWAPNLLALSLLACASPANSDTDESTDGSTTTGETSTSGDGGSSTADEGSSEDTETGSGDDCEDGDWYITGTVSRDMTPTTWNEEFVPTPEAHVFLQASAWIADGPSGYFGERAVPFEGLPFDFELCVDPAISQFPQFRDLQVTVYNHEGSELKVGDLFAEYMDFIDGPHAHMEISVYGVEHCGAPNAGGICTSNR